MTERAALAAYVRHVAGERKRIAACLEASAARIRKQQEAIQVARRNLRLIEILEKRRFSEWRAAADREQEALAQELFAARWARTRGSAS